MSISTELLSRNHGLYERMAIFRRGQGHDDERDLTELGLHPLQNDDERFWWDAFRGLLRTALEQAGYSDQLCKKFLGVYREILPMLGPRPFITGKPQHFSPFGYDSTPLEISRSYDGSRSIIRFACDPYWPPDDTFGQRKTRDTLERVSHSFPGTSIDFELFDAIAQKMWINPVNRDEILKHFPADPSQPRRAHLATAFDLLPDGTVTIKAYVTTHVKMLEAGKTQIQVASDLVRWLNQGVYRVTPILPAYCVIEDCILSCPEHSKQYIWQFGWDCVTPPQSRLKVYVYREKTSLWDLRDMWTQGGRLAGPEITTGLNIIEELWSVLCFAPQGKREDEELTNRDGQSQPILMNLEIKPGLDRPVPKLYFQPTKFGRNDLEIAQSLADWFGRRGWPLSKALVSDTSHLLSHMDLARSCSAHTFVSIGVSQGDQVTVTMYLNPTIFASIFSEENSNTIDETVELQK